MVPLKVCQPRILTLDEAAQAVRQSIAINPENAAGARHVERIVPGRRGGARRLALEIDYRWPADTRVLSVQFLDNPNQALRKRILEHMNAWNKTVNIRFSETKETGEVRIARLDSPPRDSGYWSYIGTQILAIRKDKPTLNLDSFTMKVSDAEFRRVVRHEAGHTLGFEHEHMRGDLVGKIDRRKAYAYYARTENWTKEETIAQVLTPLSKRSLMGTTESDPLSIMCYQIPAEITRDGKAITGGIDINPRDYQFAGTIYPKKRGNGPSAAAAMLAPDSEVPECAAASPPMPPKLEGAINPRRSAQAAAEFHLVIMDDFDPETGEKRTGKYEDGERTPKFTRVYASYDGARASCPMRLRAGKGEPATAYGHIIATHERIKKYTSREQGTLPEEQELISFGIYLFETLFQGKVRRLYDEARGRQRSGKLAFVITSMIPWVAEKPWEFAYDPSRARFLATEEILMLRNVITSVPVDLIPLSTGPLRILVVAAQPVGLVPLSIGQEIEVIRRGFAPLVKAGLAIIEVLVRATPGDLHRKLSTGDYNVVHFIGHGRFDDATEKAWLTFESRDGGHWDLDVRGAREIFCQRGVSLVFLNACQTGSGGNADFNKGMAQALASHGLPAVVANQYSVLDTSATSFARHFYWSLAHGIGIGQAACEARIAVNYSMGGELIDWAVPVVYARDPSMALCAKTHANAAAPEPAATPVGDHYASFAEMSLSSDIQTALPPPAMRIAVWDVDNTFPSLETTLERMNGAQGQLQFTVAALSAPLDAWDMEQRASDGTPYLHANKLAHRLQQTALELHVDVVACITRHWLRDNSWLNIYGWWPDDKKPPVVIFSCAGLDLAPAGEVTDRAIANVMVTLLSGFLTGEGTHDGDKRCPRYFNEERDLELLTGLQTFDRACLDLLRDRAPIETAALETLLKVFH